MLNIFGKLWTSLFQFYKTIFNFYPFFVFSCGLSQILFISFSWYYLSQYLCFSFLWVDIMKHLVCFFSSFSWYHDFFWLIHIMISLSWYYETFSFGLSQKNKNIVSNTGATQYCGCQSVCSRHHHNHQQHHHHHHYHHHHHHHHHHHNDHNHQCLQTSTVLHLQCVKHMYCIIRLSVQCQSQPRKVFLYNWRNLQQNQPSKPI